MSCWHIRDKSAFLLTGTFKSAANSLSDLCKVEFFLYIPERDGGKVPVTPSVKDRDRDNSNWKTLLDKGCSLGSVKTCLITSPC